jgi:hypothetical protein
MNLHNNLSVTYETQILEDGRVVSTRPAKRNLLLDSGLDGIAVRAFWDTFTNCVLGDGTTPTKRDSGSITVSIASEVATASANYFESGDVGRLLKLDSGQEVYIAAYTSPTEISVTGASDDSADEATIWYVNETGHANELVRTSTLSSDSGDVSSTWDSPQIEHKRTFVFPEETGARTYKEIGWSHTASSGGNLLGRDLIPSGGDSIAPGQQYKVVVKLRIEINPVTQTSQTNVGTGLNTSGNAIFHSLRKAFKGANNSSDIFFDLPGSLDINSDRDFGAETSDFTLNSVPSTDLYESLNAGTMTNLDYVPGSFKIVMQRTLSTNEANSTIYGFSMGMGNKAWKLKLDNPFLKDSDHTLEITFSLSWGRTLVN